MSTRRLSATPRAPPRLHPPCVLYIQRFAGCRYLLNLVQDNRKGIEAAAQQWREGTKTDSEIMQVLQVMRTQQAALSNHRLTPCCQSSGGDVLAELLDAQQVQPTSHAHCSASIVLLMRCMQGSQVRDTGIFRAHAARYEAEFLEDMTRLGAAPSCSTAAVPLTCSTCRLSHA